MLLCVAFVQISQLKRCGNGYFWSWVHSSGVFIGTACVFQLCHGAWDYQGILMGAIGWIVIVPILYAMSSTGDLDPDRAQSDDRLANASDVLAGTDDL